MFPFTDDGENFKRGPGLKYSTSENASLKKVEVKSSYRNSKFDDNTSRNGSLKRIEVKPFYQSSKLYDSTDDNAWLKKLEVNTSH